MTGFHEARRWVRAPPRLQDPTLGRCRSSLLPIARASQDQASRLPCDLQHTYRSAQNWLSEPFGNPHPLSANDSRLCSFPGCLPIRLMTGGPNNEGHAGVTPHGLNRDCREDRCRLRRNNAERESAFPLHSKNARHGGKAGKSRSHDCRDLSKNLSGAPKVPENRCGNPSPFLIRMNPDVGRDFPRFGQFDHVHRRRVAARAAGPASKRSFKFPDRRVAEAADGIKRDAGAGLTGLHSISIQPYSPLRHCQIVGEGSAGPP
jgi:hypothetical protein